MVTSGNAQGVYMGPLQRQQEPAGIRASLVAQSVKSLPTMRETWVRSLGREDPLEKEMATHSSIIAWRIPWISLVGYSPEGHKKSDMTK